MRRWTSRALVVLLLAILPRLAYEAARSSAAAFLSPPGAGSSAEVHAVALGGAARSLRFSADLHSSRLMRRLDVPRLVQGGCALHFLSVFSSLPNLPLGAACPGRSAQSSLLGLLCPVPGGVSAVGAPPGSTDAASVLALLGAAGPWALRSREAALERLLASAWAAAAASGGALQLLTSREELELFVLQRALCADTPRGCGFAAGVLAVEGVEAGAGWQAEAFARHLARQGVRSVALLHASVTGPAGGAEGLSEWGAALLGALQAEGVLVDMAHASPPALRDALRLARSPLLVSHVVPESDALRCAAEGGHLGSPVGAAAPPVSVLPDELLAEVAAAGGLVGISFAACVGAEDEPLGWVARRVAEAARALGAAHVGLGSDWEGGVTLPAALVEPAAGRAALWSVLREEGMERGELEQLFGGAALRLLRATLPSDAALEEGDARGAASKRRTTEGVDGLLYEVWL